MSSLQSSVESSLLMWALSALIVGMGAHVLLGWMRQAQEELEWDFGRVRQVALGGTAFGTALSVAIPLGLAGEALGFPLGYNAAYAAGLLFGAIAVVALLALVPVWREEAVSAAGAGVLVGLAITGLQVGWMIAVGFRPGVEWQTAFIAAAALVSAAGTGTAMAIAFPYGERARSYSYSWRVAAAGLIALSFLAGFALVVYAADLPTQIGSVYRHELPGGAISLIGGGLLPIVLLLLVMDLETRRRQRRRQWRQRRRGEPAASTYGGDSMMPGTELQPPRYRARAAAVPAPPSAPVPGAASAPALAPLSAPAPAPLAASTSAPLAAPAPAPLATSTSAPAPAPLPEPAAPPHSPPAPDAEQAPVP